MSKPALPKLPKEAVRFAKSMGLDLDGLEPEAEDIWKMLDEMSKSDPMQYEEFVGQQLRSAKEEEKTSDPSKEKRSFRPTGSILYFNGKFPCTNSRNLLCSLPFDSRLLCGDDHCSWRWSQNPRCWRKHREEVFHQLMWKRGN